MAKVTITVDTETKAADFLVDGNIIPADAFSISKYVWTDDEKKVHEDVSFGYTIINKQDNGVVERKSFYWDNTSAKELAECDAEKVEKMIVKTSKKESVADIIINALTK